MNLAREGRHSALRGQEARDSVDHRRLDRCHPQSSALIVLIPVAMLAACAVASSSRPGANASTRAPAAIPYAPARNVVASTVAQRRATLQRVLDAYRTRGANPIPGAVLAARFADNVTLVVASGLADREHGTPMPSDGRMLAGGFGKTFFAALALELAGEGRLNLDTPITAYLHGAPWLHRLPNAERVTSRMLLLQTAGYGGYPQAFYDDLANDPLRSRQHLEMLKYLFDATPKAEPGERFEPSDLDYDLLAVVEEAVTRASPHDEIDRRFLKRFALHETDPVRGPRVDGLVPGYLGPESPVGNVLTSDGTLVVNPQYEWAGGGYVSTAADLARWLSAYCRGEVLPPKLWDQVVRGVDVRGGQWGLGLFIERTPLGPAYRSSGSFPGYRTEARWYRDLDLSVAVQVNTSTSEADSLFDVLDDVARALSAPPGSAVAASP
jgi:D-alanyl-D-alanine carboxypeptidase